MNQNLERLIHLQQLDTAIEEARRKIAAHPQRLAEADARLSEANQRVDSARERLKETQDARRTLEKDAAVFQGRLSKFKDQLAAVKTNREYQAIQHEIAAAQAELGTVEERVLERMIDADAVTADIKAEEAKLAAQQKEINAEKQVLNGELAACEKTLGETSAQRAALVNTIEPRLIALYDQVARVRKGMVTSVATRDGLCSVCHVRLRPHVFQQVRQNDTIIQCESCHRILYYTPPPAGAEAPVTH